MIQEHAERLESMIEDTGQTWDLSLNDRIMLAAIREELRQLHVDFNKICAAVTATGRILDRTDYASRMNQLQEARDALQWEGDTFDSIHEQEIARLSEEHTKLRRILAHVPPVIAIAAKEAAGFGDVVKAT